MIRASPNDLQHVLRPYGLIGQWTDDPSLATQLRISPLAEDFADLGIQCRPADSPAMYTHIRFGRLGWPVRRPICRTLLPHVTFSGPDLKPLWTDSAGRAVAGWVHVGGRRIWPRRADRRVLVLGVDLVNEIIRWRQGDAASAVATPDQLSRARFGFDFERPNFLFERQLDPQRSTFPWADALGLSVARWISRLTGRPILEPLPRGLRGLILLTGDDDQAYLERYQDQLRLINGTPITYFMMPQTRHTPSTLAAMAAGANVEFGVHVDALDAPHEYEQACFEQTNQIRAMTGRPCRAVRNHGYLSRGYLGHLPSWERSGLLLDLNLPGVDGTALNGSFLPGRIRRPDGTWSDHFTLLTAIGDGMLSALAMSSIDAARRIRAMHRQIESTWPGVLVFNLHPQNVVQSEPLHRAAMAAAGSRGWSAMTVEQYLDWLDVVERLELRRTPGQSNRWVLSEAQPDSNRSKSVPAGSKPIEAVVMRVPVGARAKRICLEPWTSSLELAFS